VIPTYQRRTLVAEALESVLAQTEPGFELIVVDDGSTDGTSEFLAGRYGGDPRVRTIRQPNGGTAAARNRGLEEARAPWTAFLDSDDLWSPDHLERQLAFATARPDADLVVCDAHYHGPWRRREATVFGRRRWRAPDSLDAMLDGAWALPSAMLVRTTVGRALGFSTAYRWSEDTEFLFRFHAAGHRLVANPAVLAVWRRHRGGTDAPQKIDQRRAMATEHLQMMEAFAHRASRGSRVHYQLARRRALLLVAQRRWAEARPHLWRWWRSRPGSTRALRHLLRSLFARR
jgi:glycosyltransferase involved in cell wall biosynthesis